MSDTGPVNTDPLRPGQIVEGVVVAHQPWGIELRLGVHDVYGTVDTIYISDDPARRGPSGYPVVGSPVTAVVQGTMPSGQLRLSLRSSDITRATSPPAT